MKHADTNLEEDFVLFEKYSVSPNELFFLKIILLAVEEDRREDVVRYMTLPEAARGSILPMLQSLQNKGIILKDFKLPKPGDHFNPLDVPLNANFKKQMYKSTLDLGNELYDHYPVSCVVNGVGKSALP